MNSPLLSLVMPNYNHEKYLKKSIEAILNQSFKDFELIIIDDASTDNSLNIIVECAKKDNRIKILKNIKNIGAVKSFEKGYKKAVGKYISFPSADDYVLEGFYEEVISFLEKYQECALCTTDPCFFEDSNETKIKLLPLIKEQIFSPKQIVKIIKYTNFWIPTHATVYRRKVLLKYNFWNEDLGHLCDWYYNYQLAYSETIGYLPKYLSSMRILNNSFSMSNKRNTEIFEELFKAIRLEGGNFIKFVKNSGFIAQQGNIIFKFICFNLKYWDFLVPIISKKVMNKIYKFIISKKLYSKLEASILLKE